MPELTKIWGFGVLGYNIFSNLLVLLMSLFGGNRE